MSDDLDELVPRHDFRLVPAAVVVWLAGLLGLLVVWWLAVVCGVLAVLAALVLARRREAGAALSDVVALVAVGVLLIAPFALRLHDAAHDPLRAAADRGAAVLARLTLTDRARPVRSTGYAAVPGGGRTVMLKADVDEVWVDGATVGSSGRIVVFAQASGWSQLVPGQSLVAEGSLAPALSNELVVAVLRVRGPPEGVTPPPWWQRAAGVIRADLREAARVLDPEEAGLLPGLVVGDTSRMPPRVEAEFLDAGMSHLVAVSGSNVLIVCGAVLLLARAARAGPRTSAAIAGAALVGFVILVGYEPSVVRAGVMGAVGLLALFLGRKGSALPALAFAVILLVLLDPALAVSIGFALSVVATGALVLVAPRWAEAMRRRGVPAGFAEGFAVPLAAFAATAPIIAGFAGEVSLVTVAANVLAAPVVAPATVFGVLAACTAPFAPGLGELFVRAAGPEAGWLVLIAREAAEVPGAVIGWPGGWLGGLLAVLAVGGLVIAFRYRRFRVALAVVLVGVLLLCVPARVIVPSWPPANWSMVACDVGQGDGLVLATGDPGRAVVVDAGTELGAIDRCLDRLGVDRVPLIALSHLHADHIGGLDSVLEGRAVGGVAVGPGRRPEWAWRQVLRVTARHRVPLLELSIGDHQRWRKLDLRVIGPRYVPSAGAGADEGTDVNNSSLVIMAGTPLGRVLFTGDVELAAQSDLLAAGVDLRADVLKVPHHGSRYVLPRFFEEVRPRIAVISVGAGNSYGHPNQGVVDGLSRAGATVVRTDSDGDTALVADDEGTMLVRRDARGPPARDS